MSILMAEYECGILFRYQNFIPTGAEIIHLKGKMNVCFTCLFICGVLPQQCMLPQRISNLPPQIAVSLLTGSGFPNFSYKC